LIAGEGAERQRLEVLIRQNRLQNRVMLLGHVARDQMESLYRRADLVVLTSRSEGIPLVLMEAMVRGRIVVAPAITGIPEIVISEKTGFLYTPGSIKDFVRMILVIKELMRVEQRYAVGRLDWIRHAARVQVLHNFSHSKNLSHFCDCFLHLVANRHFATENWRPPHEDLILQQI
jgi:glycosyltransferase involved in cell wall biosynthesis